MEQTEEASSSAQNKRILKGIGYFILFFIGLAFWYIAIPAVTIWYLYRKNKKLTPKTKLIISSSVTVVFLILGSASIYTSRAPEIRIASPDNGFSIQATSTAITGTIDPADADITINGIPVEADDSGDFNYTARLRNESNIFTIEAKNASKVDTQKLTINRTFTEAEIAEREQQEAEAKVEREEKRVVEAKEKLQKELDSLAGPFDNSVYRDSVLALQIELALFSTWADMIDTYSKDSNEELQALATELKRKVSALQIKEFPLIRKDYVSVLAKEMWENNVDITSLGGNHKTIVLTAGIFANNKNKADAQRLIQESLQLFRFTQSRYKWYEYDDEYTYYDIESLADSEVVVLE